MKAMLHSGVAGIRAARFRVEVLNGKAALARRVAVLVGLSLGLVAAGATGHDPVKSVSPGVAGLTIEQLFDLVVISIPKREQSQGVLDARVQFRSKPYTPGALACEVREWLDKSD